MGSEVKHPADATSGPSRQKTRPHQWPKQLRSSFTWKANCSDCEEWEEGGMEAVLSTVSLPPGCSHSAEGIHCDTDVVEFSS